MEECSSFNKKNMCKYKVYETDDFFEMMRRGLMAKCAVTRRRNNCFVALPYFAGELFWC